jgi:membrane-bound lytic murein transglycosylase B
MDFFKRTLVLILIGAIVLGIEPGVATAQSSACTDSIAGKTQAQLQADLDACNKEIAEWTDVLNNTKKQSASYQRDVAALTAKINAAQANIKSKNIAISNLSKNIAEKQATIVVLDSKLERGRQSLAELLRKTHALDSYTLAEAMLSDKALSDFFIDANTYAATEKSLQDVFDELKGTKSATEEAKAELNKQKQAEEAAKAEIDAKKKQVESDQRQKQQLLADSKSKEKSYAQTLAERQAKAAQIRSALFGLRDSAAIPFGTALQYAQAASAKTGVRPALILGILQQESNLGQNVGSCVITNLTSGETKNVNSGKIYAKGIHPTRDLPLLQDLLPAIGRDPLTTKVSCPLSIGYGGAMGPAQFIPSTWNIMRSKVASATGKANPDPWNPADAIMAMALFLKDLGASSGTYTAERTAACRYYGGGSSCTTTTSAYGNQVMSKATAIQANIDILQSI